MQTYRGGCHCGKVTYEFEGDIKDVTHCNCSICTKRGLLLTFVPEDKFRLLSGEEILQDYQFYKKRIHHYFCPSCGVESFAIGTGPDGSTMAAVNVRCVEGVDIDHLNLVSFDGRSM